MQIGFIGGGRMCASFSRYLQTCPIDIAGTLTKADLYLDFTQRKVNGKNACPVFARMRHCFSHRAG